MTQYPKLISGVQSTTSNEENEPAAAAKLARTGSAVKLRQVSPQEVEGSVGGLALFVVDLTGDSPRLRYP